jgi:hypothetical protein
MSWGGIVSIASWLVAGGFVVLITLEERDLSVLRNVQTDTGVHTSSYSMDIGFFPGGKRSA